MIGNVIQSRFLENNDYPTAAALTFILMAAILFAVAIYARVPRHRRADERPMTAAMVDASPRPSSAVRAGRWLRDHLIYVYTVFAIGYLMLPVIVMALFSFNDPPGKSNVAWHGFTLDAWLNPFGVPGLFDVVQTSILVAILATIVATALGTLIALALVRYNFRGSATTNTLIFLPMATPRSCSARRC